jgi:hypothetical protein
VFSQENNLINFIYKCPICSGKKIRLEESATKCQNCGHWTDLQRKYNPCNVCKTKNGYLYRNVTCYSCKGKGIYNYKISNSFTPIINNYLVIRELGIMNAITKSIEMFLRVENPNRAGVIDFVGVLDKDILIFANGYFHHYDNYIIKSDGTFYFYDSSGKIEHGSGNWYTDNLGLHLVGKHISGFHDGDEFNSKRIDDLNLIISSKNILINYNSRPIQKGEFDNK